MQETVGAASKLPKDVPPCEVEWWEFLERPERSDPIRKLSEYVNTKSDRFDPVHYFSSHAILCQKLHYSVPLFLDDVPGVLIFDSEVDQLKIYNMEKLVAKEGDEGSLPQAANKWRRLERLKDLDQVIQIDDIYGFVYGSFLSRFWMLRIGMNQLILDNSKKVQQAHKKTQRQKEEQEKHR